MVRRRRWLLAQAGMALLGGSAGCQQRTTGSSGTTDTTNTRGSTGTSRTPAASDTRSRAATDGSGALAYRAVTLEAAPVGGPADDERYCRLAAGSAAELGVAAGMQLRVETVEPAEGTEFTEAVFTVATVEDAVASGIVHAPGADLAAIGATDGAAARVSATVPHPAAGPDSAEADDEFVEVVLNPATVGDAPALVLGPHGGHVERWTGRQADHVARTYGLPGWACYGFNEGGGAYDRWHVTATALHPGSFPGLGAVTAERHPVAVAFHGQSAEHVTIGGTATALRERVVEALRESYADAGVDVPVRVAAGGENAGVSEENVVNWASVDGAGGVQVEQPAAVRDSAAAAERTAEAVLDAVLDRRP